MGIENIPPFLPIEPDNTLPPSDSPPQDEGKILQDIEKNAELIQKIGLENAAPLILAEIEETFSAQISKEKKSEIQEILDSTKKELIPDQIDLDNRIRNFAKGLKKEKESRTDYIKNFFHEADSKINEEIKKVETANSTTEKIEILEKILFKANYVSLKCAKAISDIDPTLLDTVENALAATELEGELMLNGIKAVQCQKRGKQIAQLQKNAEQIKKKLLSAKPDEKTDELESGLRLIEKKIEELKKKNNEALILISKTTIQKILKTGGKTLVDISEKLSHILPEGSAFLDILNVTSSASNLLSTSFLLGINIYKTFDQCKQLNRLKLNILLLENIKIQTKSPIEAVILGAKLDRMKDLTRQVNIQAIQKSAALTLSAFTTCFAVMGVLSAAGIAVGTGGTITTGAIAIGIFSGGLAATGGIYTGYKYRNELMYAATTLDIPIRNHFKARQLQQQKQIFQIASRQLTHTEEILRGLQTLLQESWDLKEKLDEKTGKIALTKQILATKQIFFLEDLLKTEYQKAQEATKTVIQAKEKIKKTGKTISNFTKRSSEAEVLLTWRNVMKKFSSYDPYTILSIESYIRKSLEEPTSSQEIADFLKRYNYPTVHPLTFEQVLDFILEDKTVCKQSLAPRFRTQ